MSKTSWTWLKRTLNVNQFNNIIKAPSVSVISLSQLTFYFPHPFLLSFSYLIISVFLSHSLFSLHYLFFISALSIFALRIIYLFSLSSISLNSLSFFHSFSLQCFFHRLPLPPSVSLSLSLSLILSSSLFLQSIIMYIFYYACFMLYVIHEMVLGHLPPGHPTPDNQPQSTTPSTIKLGQLSPGTTPPDNYPQ